jgi:hypothetical protein
VPVEGLARARKDYRSHLGRKRRGLHCGYRVVVDKHRRTLTFETETGKGTTFIIRLPRTESASDNAMSRLGSPTQRRYNRHFAQGLTISPPPIE